MQYYKHKTKLIRKNINLEKVAPYTHWGIGDSRFTLSVARSLANQRVWGDSKLFLRQRPESLSF